MFSTLTNFHKSITLIIILLVALFYCRDESQVVDNNPLGKKEKLSGEYQKESYEYRVHLGIIKHSKRRLQESRNDSRQL
jgi:hypothetical protein